MQRQERSAASLVRQYEREYVWISPRTRPEDLPRGDKVIYKRIFISEHCTVGALRKALKLVRNPLDVEKEEYELYNCLWLAEGSIVHVIVRVSVDQQAVNRADLVERSFVGTDANGDTIRMFCFLPQDPNDYYTARLNRLVEAIETRKPLQVAARLRTVRNEEGKLTLRITVERCYEATEGAFEAHPSFCEAYTRFRMHPANAHTFHLE